MGCKLGDTYGRYMDMWFKKTKEKLRDVKVLIIDEISMVSAEFFEALSSMVRRTLLDTRSYGT